MGRHDTFRDVTIRREKVHNALLWLLRNNPHYSNATINQHALESLPVDGVPSDIMTVESEEIVFCQRKLCCPTWALPVITLKIKSTMRQQK